MAKTAINNGKQKEGRIGLFKYLTFAPEAREDGGVSEPVEGRFRYFGKVFGKNNGQLMLANLLFIVTLLPLLAVLIILSVFGPENLSYRLNDVTKIPYFLSGIGMGLGASSDAVLAKIDMLSVYAWTFLFVGIGVFIAGIGLSGMMHLCVKFIWQDSFVCKKDNYGNNVPRAIVEFFRGVKKYWWQTLLVTLIAGVLVAGIGNIFVLFLSKLWAGTAGAGEWILVVLASAIGVIGTSFVLLLLPMVVMYDISFVQKMKNAIIITFQMPLQNLFLVVLFALPIVLASVTGGFISIIIIAVLLVFGCPFYGLTTANYLQYFAEKIITPVYNASMQKSKKSGKKKK